jgi:hypothetical protein
MTTDYKTQIEALDSAERDRLRRSALEAEHAALKQNIADGSNITWRKVLEAYKVVEKLEK